MEETPNLLSNIRFKETKKGYDPEQVDNFMLKLGEQVGELREMLRQAAQRAEVAEAQVSEATKAKAAAEATVEQAKADAAKAKEEAAAAVAAAASQPATPANEIEAASGVLAMAQKTADAAVEEAEAKAKEIVAEGRSRAAVMVIEAEQEIDRIKNRASQQIDKLAGERTAEVDAEVQRLKSEREQLKIDVDLLRSYVEEHRSKLRLGVEALERIINEEGALDMGEAPDVSANDDLGTTSSSGAGAGANGDDTAAPAADPDATPTDASASALPTEPATAPANGDGADGATLTTAAPDAAAPVVIPAATPDDADPATDAETDRTKDGAPGASPIEVSTPAPAVVPTEPGAPATETSTDADERADDGADTSAVPIVTLEDLGSKGSAETPAATRTRAEDPDAAVKVGSLLEGPASSEGPAAAATPKAAASPGATQVIIGSDPKSAAAPADANESTVDGSAAGSAVAASTPAGKGTIDLTGEHTLFPTEGEPTQLFDVLGDDTPSPRVVLTSGDAPAATPLVNRELPLPTPGKAQVDSSLGTPDAEADEAMRAFFEQDAAVSKETKSGRFLRRK